MICLLVVPCSLAHGAEIDVFATGALCGSLGDQIPITHVDADGDPDTGACAGGVWYPNETMVDVYHVQGNSYMNHNGWYFSYIADGTAGRCSEPGWEDESGIVVMRFIDVMASGHVYNDPATWSEKFVTEFDFSWTHDLCFNYAEILEPYFKTRAYGHWEAVNPGLQYAFRCDADGYCSTTGSRPLTSATGFSEIVFTRHDRDGEQRMTAAGTPDTPGVPATQLGRTILATGEDAAEGILSRPSSHRLVLG